MEQLTKKQLEVGTAIINILENIRKTPKERRTEAFIEKKRTETTTLWSEFQSRHNEIIALNEPKHDYFSKNYAQQVEKAVKDISAVLTAYAEALMKPIDSDTRTNDQGNLHGGKIAENLQLNEKLSTCKRLAVRIESLSHQLRKINLNIKLNPTIIDFHSRTLADSWGKLEQIHEDLLVQCDESSLETSEVKDALMRYENTKDEYNRKIMSLQEMKAEAQLPTEQDVRLPRLTIPIFEGRYETWRAFHDIFVKLIHNNKKLANVEKLQYLKSNLKGEAAKLLNHLDISDANYMVAWEIVNARYDNKRKLISAHLQALLTVPKLEKESVSGLKKIHDTVKECLHGISNLEVDTSSWAPIIIHLMMQKFDYDTLRVYEQSLPNPKELPSFETFFNFLEARFQALETIGENKRLEHKSQKIHTSFKGNPPTLRNYHTNPLHQCRYCRAEHSIYNCPEFQALEVQQRRDFITQNKVCRNCLNHNYQERCKSKKKCSICHKPHHSMLHEERNTKPSVPKTAYQPAEIARTHNHISQQNNTVLLATALIKARGINGHLETLRALIDPGSQASYITENTAQQLALPRTKVYAEISGIGTSGAGIARSKIQLEIQPRFPSLFKYQFEALILPKLTSVLPDKTLSCTLPEENKIIADPTFNKPGPIDVIIGADVFGAIILDGVQKNSKGLIMQNTELGWIVSGPTQTGTPAPKILSMISNVEIDNQLKRFWELEQIPTEQQMSDMDQRCEQHFMMTHVRNPDGTYTVTIPFKETPSELESTRKLALVRFLQIEKRFQRDICFKEEYTKFISEYIKLKHMTIVESPENTSSKVCYLPHHAVIKAESTSTKLRVVFDASAKTTEGKSLNSHMHIGPQLQQDLSTILLRWRKHQYALTADIEKMYRQIKIADEDQDLQRILWRSSPDEPIREYKLTTVTYGTAAAPYLAIRTMQQLANDENDTNPTAAHVIRRDFYVDDMLTGADTLEEANEIQKGVIKLLARGGFKLRKWTSNNRELLKTIPEDLRAKDILEITDGNTIKTLGIHWSPIKDTFHFKVNILSHHKLTKRGVLSDAARVFDPLGWLTPVTVRAKLILQKLWVAGITWDEALPSDLEAEWTTFKNELPTLEEIQIQRWTHQKSSSRHIELHGFCDASEKAYAAAIYSKIITPIGNAVITLLTAKSKIAPVNSKMTIPRLELCGALLLAKLMQHTVKAMEIDTPSIFLWSDSMVALAWIKGDPTRWKSFIAHRVSEIQSITNPSQWNYIKSEENPADCASRGISPSQIYKHQSWWTGPSWLKTSTENWPKTIIRYDHSLEQKTKRKFTTLTTTMHCTEIFERYSTIRKLTRVMAYCNRFIQNSRKYTQRKKSTALEVNELRKATNLIIKMIQASEFPDDIKNLKSKGQLNPKSKLVALNPFLDKNGLLRVGGRLKHTAGSLDEKHPMILPQKGHLTNLVIKEAHEKTLHGGNQSTLAYIRRRFWIINPRDNIRQHIHKCMKCFRVRAKATQQLMGNLPAARVTPSRPFTHTGVDYAGPIQVKMSNGRGYKSSKGYIAIFICLATKAIHIEVVSDLTSEAFLAALKRFTSRRGLCSHLYSDCGSNFIGAKRILDEEVRTAIQNSAQEVATLLTGDGIQWHFNPPASPHMGGLWEAGVKSIKHHLKRVIGETTLSYEELATVLTQIEACLNSRPLCPLSNDPEDVNALTPGHFLIGSAPLSPPSNPNAEEKISNINRWKLVNKLQKDFWKIWSSEYLSRLQQRPKWQTKEENIRTGELVLIKEENIPPTRWLLARVIEVHPGSDGLIRVVSLRCKENVILKRPITKICRLPISDGQENSEDPLASKINSNVAISNPSVSPMPLDNTINLQTPKARKRKAENDYHTDKAKRTVNFDITESFNQFVNQARSDRIQRKRKHVVIHPVTGYSSLVPIENQIAAAEAYKKRYKRDLPKSLKAHYSRTATNYKQQWTMLHPLILGILMLWLIKLGNCSYNITYPKPGLYIESIGEAKLKRGTLRIELNYVLNTTSDQNRINKTITQMEEVCKKTKEVSSDVHCKLLLQHLKDKRTTILNEISSLHQEEHKRSKRGILGKILESVFGVNDEVYTDISTLQGNQLAIQQAIQHQSSIMLSTISTVNETEIRVAQKLNMFGHKLNKVLEEINKEQGWFTDIDTNRVNINMLSAYQIAVNLLDDLEAHYVNLIRVTLRGGNLLELISPAKIKKIIEEASKTLPFNLKISSTPEARLEWERKNSSVRIYGFMPITEPDKYNLFKITPIPKKVGDNTYVAADINKAVLATNYNSQSYFELTDIELAACIRQTKDSLLCT